MPLVVTDSTVLISLDRIDRLGLLPALFPDVVAPPAVVAEFGWRPGWLEVREVSKDDTYRALYAQLDAGEAEAIALALALPGSRLLIDERRGRRCARALGLEIVGTFGLFVEAKRQGLVPAVRPLLGDLLDAGFRASEALCHRTLALAGEADGLRRSQRPAGSSSEELRSFLRRRSGRRPAARTGRRRRCRGRAAARR